MQKEPKRISKEKYPVNWGKNTMMVLDGGEKPGAGMRVARQSRENTGKSASARCYIF